MLTLTSLQNPAVQAARALQTAKGRTAARALWLDGEHMVAEALRWAAASIRELYVDDARLEAYAALVAQAPSAARVYAVPARVLESISQVKTSQGIGAVCAQPDDVPLARQQGRLMLLENVQDPGNVGTILRTIDAAGFDGCVLTPGCADPFSPKTLRATMGSVFRIPVTFASSAADAARELAARGYAVIGAALDGQPFYARAPLPRDLCVLIGNEGAGLTPEALAACTHRYKLPMRGHAESLNAAVAAAVFMYEITREDGGGERWGFAPDHG